MKTPSDFSFLNPAVSSEPWDFYEVLHEQCPVYQIPETGAYVITRYDDLRAVLKNHDVFSSDVGSLRGGPLGDIQQNVLVDGGVGPMCRHFNAQTHPCMTGTENYSTEYLPSRA